MQCAANCRGRLFALRVRVPKIFQTVRSERPLTGGSRVEVDFHAAGEPIPGVLLLPEIRPAPGALLLHGYSSRKEDLAEGVGAGLLARGVASLAIDLPLHGARRGPAPQSQARDPLTLFRLWGTAKRECELAFPYLGARPEVDRERRAVAGYSVGSFLALELAAGQASVRAVVVAAGGDLPQGLPFAAIARRVVDPTRAVRRLAGRPLLMVHGTRDRTVLPEQAERLFAAAGEPKQLRWWDAGHRLPAAAVEGAADWLAAHLKRAASAP